MILLDHRLEVSLGKEFVSRLDAGAQRSSSPKASTPLLCQGNVTCPVVPDRAAGAESLREDRIHHEHHLRMQASSEDARSLEPTQGALSICSLMVQKRIPEHIAVSARGSVTRSNLRR